MPRGLNTSISGKRRFTRTVRCRQFDAIRALHRSFFITDRHAVLVRDYLSADGMDRSVPSASERFDVLFRSSAGRDSDRSRISFNILIRDKASCGSESDDCCIIYLLRGLVPSNRDFANSISSHFLKSVFTERCTSPIGSL